MLIYKTFHARVGEPSALQAKRILYLKLVWFISLFQQKVTLKSDIPHQF